jgi:hypothetical protein
MTAEQITRRTFLLSAPYDAEFDAAFSAFFKVSKYLFSRLKNIDDLRTISDVNLIFYELLKAYVNRSYNPHLTAGLFATLLTSPRSEHNFLYRPTLITKRLVQRAALIESELIRNRERLKAARKKMGLGDEVVEISFSPHYFVRQFFTDPEYVASDAYVHALIRADIFASSLVFATQHLRPDEPEAILNGHPFDRIRWYCRFERVAAALQKITLFRRGRDNIGPVDATDFIVMHLLASRGIMTLRFGAQSGADTKVPRISRDEFFENESLIVNRGRYEFRVQPEIKDLPTAAELVNELDGLPIPVPGGDALLFGGLRFTEESGVVMRISGRTGTGKTSVALGLAVALAPLGTRTVYLSAEEQPIDLEHRIQTLVPPHVRRLAAFHRMEAHWFSAEHLSGTPQEKFRKVEGFLEYVRKKTKNESGAKLLTPPGAIRLLIVIDGAHEILRDTTNSLFTGEETRKLVEQCRDTGSCVLVLSAKNEESLPDDLDYLVDLVAGVDFAPARDPWEEPVRTLSIRKTRRQVSRVGTHVLHISGRQGLRIAPHVAAQLDQRRHIKWVHPRTNLIYDFLLRPEGATSSYIPPVQIYDRSQILITGAGSGGKSAFGLKLLSCPLLRRDEESGRVFIRKGRHVLSDEELQQRSLFSARAEENKALVPEDEDEQAMSATGEELDVTATWFPSTLPRRRKILILSFLYQEDFYRKTWAAVGKFRREDALQKDRMPRFTFDVHPFTPGYLRPEDFLRIISRLLDREELEGWPYDGVFIDGLHNVYLQFPYLEQNEMVWPMLFEMLRTRGLTVVTTHTYFSVDPGVDARILNADIDSSRRKVAPLLHALVQATDFSLRVSPERHDRAVQLKKQHRGQRFDTRIDVLGALGQSIQPSQLYWDRDRGVIFTL